MWHCYAPHCTLETKLATQAFTSIYSINGSVSDCDHSNKHHQDLRGQKTRHHCAGRYQIIIYCDISSSWKHTGTQSSIAQRLGPVIRAETTFKVEICYQIRLNSNQEIAQLTAGWTILKQPSENRPPAIPLPALMTFGQGIHENSNKGCQTCLANIRFHLGILVQTSLRQNT